MCHLQGLKLSCNLRKASLVCFTRIKELKNYQGTASHTAAGVQLAEDIHLEPDTADTSDLYNHRKYVYWFKFMFLRKKIHSVKGGNSHKNQHSLWILERISHCYLVSSSKD